MLKGLTYGYEHATTWYISGAHLLGLSGLRPDCTVAQKINIARTLPPRMQPVAPFITNSPDCVEFLSKELGAGLHRVFNTGEAKMRICSVAFFQNEVGASCLGMLMPGMAPQTQGWVLGVAPVSSGPPDCI